MNTHIVVLRTHKPEHFFVAVTELDTHLQAGEFRESLGIFPLDVANFFAEQVGGQRGLPVITYQHLKKG